MLDQRGLLPEGVHEVTLEQVGELFGRIQRTTRRLEMFGKLREYVEQLKRWELAEAVIIDGSFVMGSVDQPSDIDMIVLLCEAATQRELKPVEENLLGKPARKQYRVEAKPAAPHSSQEASWVDFFGQVNTKWCSEFQWPNRLRKGLLRVTL